MLQMHEALELLEHAHNSLRTFRNVPVEDQAFTSYDEDVLNEIASALHNAGWKDF